MFKLLFVLTLISCGSKAKGQDAANPTLIGGKPAPVGSFDPVVYISMSNGGRCSATIVGDRALITAAHCSRSEGRVTFQHNKNQYSAICTGNPRYPREDYDVSMCIIDRNVASVKAASIKTEQVKLKETVTMSGYGCIRPGGSGGNDGILRYGDVDVISFTRFDFVTKGLVASCFGDSGSGVFSKIKDLLNDQLWQVGVVSKGNIQDTSYTANLAVTENSSWIKSWSETKKVSVCGITKECVKPDPKPEPEPEPEPIDPEDKCRNLRSLAKFYEKKAEITLDLLDQCEAAN